ncbi:dihydroorotase (plasmid) [Geminicoccaceae bacterium 1502E]|nr:dihydroorotase [Geminicoccaceae bacterium 1502E]
MSEPARLRLRRPDDWHLHLRDGAMLRAVLPFSAAQMGRAIIMPNLVPPVRRTHEAVAYRERIMAALPEGSRFKPLMVCYLSDDTEAADLLAGHADGVFTAVKLYPAHATTNSQFGVTDLGALAPVLEAMEKAGIPLLVHGEVTDHEVDIFDREAVFIERVLAPLVARHQGLKVVMEHITTEEGVAFVRANAPRVGATITPHHLIFNRNAIFAGGIRPHNYCLPVAKRERHRLALREAATSGEAAFFLGTDSAPHLRSAKESSCGCAGVFNAPAAIEAYAQVFAEEGALDRLEAFASLNGPAFYRLEPNEERITLVAAPTEVPAEIPVPGEGAVFPFLGGERTAWSLAPDA